MKPSHLILIGILLCAMLVGGVSAVAPTASFTTNTTSGVSPLAVQFNDTSTNTPTGWSWFFGDEQYNQSFILQTATAPMRASGQAITLASNGDIISFGGLGSYNAGLGAYVTTPYVYKSTDKGATWSTINNSFINRSGSRMVTLNNGDIIMMGGQTTSAWNTGNGDVWRSTDSGVKWSRINASAFSGRYDIASVKLSDDTIMIMGGTDSTSGAANIGDTWKSTDGGLTWSNVTSASTYTKRHGTSTTVLNNNSVLVIGGFTTAYVDDVWMSTNAGNTWTQINASATGSGRRYSALYHFPDDSVVLVGGSSATAYNDSWRSTDQGYTWTQINATNPYVSSNSITSIPVLPDGSSVLLDNVFGVSTKAWRFNPVLSTTQNPVHTYTGSAGQTFNVSLQSYNAAGYNISTQVTWVNISTGALAPVASFTPVLSTGVSPYGVTFTDASTNTPTYWNWTIEGKIGNTTKYLNASASQNPSFSFLEGNFTISLGAGNADGFDISDQDSWVNVSFGGPVVSFSTNVTSGVNPLALYLNDTSTLSPTYWNTSWGDGADSWTNQTSFPATNITHIYSTAGSYWINHYATNPYGTANGTPLLITVYGFANSQFSSFNTLGGVPFTTYLYDTSTNTTGGTNSWYWDLGDGNVSTAQNLYYTWNITGTYSVNHSFSNGLSTDWENKTAYVTVGTSVIAPVASFNGTPSLGANPLTQFFIDVSANTPTSWYWMFGDGSTSTDQNPSHTYTDSGFFTVNFSATNTAGTDWENKTQFVVVY